MLGPHIGSSIPTSPQWKTIQSQQEKCHFVESPQFVPTLAGKGVLEKRQRSLLTAFLQALHYSDLGLQRWGQYVHCKMEK